MFFVALPIEVRARIQRMLIKGGFPHNTMILSVPVLGKIERWGTYRFVPAENVPDAFGLKFELGTHGFAVLLGKIIERSDVVGLARNDDRPLKALPIVRLQAANVEIDELFALLSEAV